MIILSIFLYKKVENLRFENRTPSRDGYFGSGM